MKEFNLLKTMEQNAVLHKNDVLFADDTTAKGITYGQYYVLTGRVYAYLKSKGIGREDFVLICLPRGIQPLIALGGVLRAGAAFVIVEDNYAPERIAFIRRDCGCKMVIDAGVWEEIQLTPAISGYEPVCEHAAAFAVYTSGTTGNPKGVLHEYGNIARCLRSHEMTSCGPLFMPDDRFALVVPLNFIAATMVIFLSLYHAFYLNVVPYSVVKDPAKMRLFQLGNRITGTFLSPSYLRKLKEKPPTLRFCLTGSEPANGIWLDGLKIHNMYAMSEAGFCVSHFLIDKNCENTPVGRSECGDKIFLLDENGQEVPSGKKGEICFENPYVRGYINLPEQTAEAFRDGLYHTGDLGRFDSEGQLVICGRLNDMVKINGNRVEPGEIEGVAKKVLGVDWAAARIFDDGKKVFICVYYLEDMTVDFEKTRAAMEQYLPYYMLPSFFIHIDKIPLKATGKMDRRALPAPSFENYQDDYAAPRDEVETALCRAFEKVLERDRIGIRDDFYQLGGDSLGSMDVLTLSNLPGLTATDIFRGHTPEKIAELYRAHQKNDGVSMEKRNAEALKHSYPLTTEQLYMIDYQLYTPMSTMYNLYTMLVFDKNEMPMERLTAALNTTIRKHPSLLTEFYFNEDGEILQHYVPDHFHDVVLEKTTEAELAEIQKALVRPFKIIGSLLARFRVFETEKAGYLFMDIHHTIFDGTSFKVFFSDLQTACRGQEVTGDYYYAILDQRKEVTRSSFYRESRDYFESLYGGTDWCRHIAYDNHTRENKGHDIEVALPVTEAQLDHLDELLGISRNDFFIAVSALTVAIYEKNPNVLLSWIYNGRGSRDELSATGLFFRDLPLGITFTRAATLRSLYTDIAAQVNGGIAHSCYPYVENNSRVVEDDLTCVLYQNDLRNLAEIPGLVDEVELETESSASQTAMDIEILNTDEGLVMMLDYAASRYRPESIDRYRRIFCAAVSVLLEHTEDGTVTVSELVRSISGQLGEDADVNQNEDQNEWLK